MALRNEAYDPDPAGLATTAERASIQAAVELVASGCATRVVLTGLRRIDDVIPWAKRFGSSRHVRVRRLRPIGDGPTDLVVEADPGLSRVRTGR